ncbi:MAG: M23 family metallopeptidase [Bacteroidales bacterium]|nr:M23 family metallopeptidase [Bacteroidales bacterium]MDZ4204019.1 M23 family metallopeptidase [Bacteroidales bacterium]
MQKVLKQLSVIIFLLQSGNITGQTTYPHDYFRLPVDITPSLSGSFGELRSNHFHSGIDFRTQGAEGKPVYASADGYVSRIRISPVGFGKAIYIEHPNGFTTVYAHVRNFKPSIQQYIIREQYRKESFDVDYYPEPKSIFVKKGEVIAWSGNSGSSGGPHLHYEIRRSSNQFPINPALFGIKITDNISPVIQRLKIYPADNYSSINNKSESMVFEASGSKGSYRLTTENPLSLSGTVAFGLQYYDLHDHSNLQLGIVSMDVFINAQLVYSHRIDQFSFDETRYVNAVIDYEELIRNKRRFVQTRILPNNPLKIYEVVKQNGVFDFSDPGLYQIRIVVTDSYGNQAMLDFTATGSPASSRPLFVPDTTGKNLFRHHQINSFTADKFIIELPLLALYDDIWFTSSERSPERETFSNVFEIHNTCTPVHRSYILKIKPSKLPEKLRSKSVIARKDDKNKWVSEGGHYEAGWVSTAVRSFGVFSVVVDTLAPVIAPVNIHPGKDISNQNTIALKINDEFSGIKTYHGSLNGQWILMDYDPKNESLVYMFDARLIKGENKFVLLVSDNVGNNARYEAKLMKQ